MPKRLIQQRRGRGSPRFRAPSHRFKAKVSYPPLLNETLRGKIVDIFHCPAHSAPVMEVRWENGMTSYLVAPLGVKVGDEIQMGPNAEIKVGNILPLSQIPEGQEICMIEIRPGDGGKLIRAAGCSARIIGKDEKYVYVQLPSRAIKAFLPHCRAMIGQVAGAGRLEKPIVKAGKKYHIMKARNKYWPHVARCGMNPYEHPFGGKKRWLKVPKTVSRNAPPGAKVGSFGARRTGYRR